MQEIYIQLSLQYKNIEMSEQSSVTVAKSCEDRIQNDLSDLEHDEEPKVKPAKSLQENSSEDSGQWNARRSDQKQQLKKVVKKRLTKPQGQQSNLMDGEIIMQGDIIHSEEVSVQGSLNGRSDYVHSFQIDKIQVNVLEQRRKQQMSDNIKLNIMLVGGAGLGKSTFIDAFLGNKHQRLPVIREKTLEIKVVPAFRQNRELKIDLNFIDTPGHDETNYIEYGENVVDYIKRKFQEYQQNKEQSYRRSKIMRGDNKLTDERVHCCLFFLKGPRKQESDWIIMKMLQKFVMIIPVIAKSDCYSIQEIKEVKRSLRQQRKARNVQWFNFQQFIRQKYPDKLQQLKNGPYGESPPFVLVSCLERINDPQHNSFHFGRIFKWGTCYLENPSHTDFLLLKNLLLYYLSPFMKQFVQSYAYQYLRQLKSSQSQVGIRKSSVAIRVIGTIFMVGVITYTMIRHRKL